MVSPHPPLFCKPSHGANSVVNVFSKSYSEVNGELSFRSLDLKYDLTVIHSWVQRDYALEYWQMNGHYSQLFAIYQCMELNPYSHSFVGSLTLPPAPAPKGEDESTFSTRVVCQFDVYSVFADELKEHISHEENDCGFHLLMAPIVNPIRGLTVCVVKAFLEYYFSFSEAKRMYAEPDVNNLKSIALLERCGFKWIKTVQMSYKVAHVYCIEKSQFKA